MILKAGQKLNSAVSDAQVIVVKAPASEVELGCGGAPLVAEGSDAPAGAVLDAELAEGPQIGKRYADEELGLELLCTRAGAGSLTCNGEVLAIKGAKPLPASD
jgi:hypothetical protein